MRAVTEAERTTAARVPALNYAACQLAVLMTGYAHDAITTLEAAELTKWYTKHLLPEFAANKRKHLKQVSGRIKNPFPGYFNITLADEAELTEDEADELVAQTRATARQL